MEVYTQKRNERLALERGAFLNERRKKMKNSAKVEVGALKRLT